MWDWPPGNVDHEKPKGHAHTSHDSERSSIADTRDSTQLTSDVACPNHRRLLRLGRDVEEIVRGVAELFRAWSVRRKHRPATGSNHNMLALDMYHLVVCRSDGDGVLVDKLAGTDNYSTVCFSNDFFPARNFIFVYPIYVSIAISFKRCPVKTQFSFDSETIFGCSCGWAFE